MFRAPFLPLALLLLGLLVIPIFLPLAVLFGYPMLLLIGLCLLGRGLIGRLERPAELAAVWFAYLGIIVTIHGILMGADIALAGAPPTEDEKRFGKMVAYLGGALAIASVVVAYALDLRRRSAAKKPAKPTAIDDGLA